MEINGIGSAYSDYLTSSASKNKASALESKLDSDYSNSSDEEESSYATKMVDYFKDSAVQELTQQATNQNGIGIAQTLYEQMKRQYSATDPASL